MERPALLESERWLATLPLVAAMGVVIVILVGLLVAVMLTGTGG
jgi:hypothetical protein